jgi:glycosyltransferase involved in cell wall biosynthesis
MVRPKVLQAYNDTATFYAAAALKLQANCTTKLIAAFHTWPSHPTRGARNLTCWACSSAKDVVAVSSDLQKRLCVEGWTRKCITIPNGVDLDAFRPNGPNDDWRVRLNIAVGGILVGHIARFDEIKRHRDLLLAAKILEKECPEVVLVLVGQGPLLDEMKELGAGRANVRFVSQIMPTAPFLRSLDIFVLCSLYEAAPLVLLEAMAAGVASVVTPVGGIPEMIGANTPVVCAVQVPSNSPIELARALTKLARNPGERHVLAERARQLSLGHSFEDEWRAYSTLYERH